MKTTNSQAAQFILRKLGHIPSTIHEVLDKASTEARFYFESRKLDIDPYLFPSIVRFEAKCLLDNPLYKSIGYQFVVLSNNGLLLIYQHEGCTYRIRVRKADEDGEMPIQNQSKILKEFCKQPNPFPQFLPGMQPEEMGQFLSPSLLNLFVVWDVDHNYILTSVSLACPDGSSGNVHFADEIPHAATTIFTESSFDDEAEELEDIVILPFRRTGTGENDGDE
jgi:hypothetical protein